MLAPSNSSIQSFNASSSSKIRAVILLGLFLVTAALFLSGHLAHFQSQRSEEDVVMSVLSGFSDSSTSKNARPLMALREQQKKVAALEQPPHQVPSTPNGRAAQIESKSAAGSMAIEKHEVPDSTSTAVKVSVAPVPDSTSSQLGTAVFLAGRRNQITFFNTIDRFCFLIRAIRSFDQHVNAHYGPYPIHVLLAKDHDKDDGEMDAPYTDQDKALIRSWAPHSQVFFVEINMYSKDALSPGITNEVIARFREEHKRRGLPPVKVGYASMCRLWSWRLQNMDFLTPFKYYMRMDDDSLLTRKPGSDPFLDMEKNNLVYVWRRAASDQNGIDALAKAAQPYISEESFQSPFARRAGGSLLALTGSSPYNNFHISRVDFWRSPKWIQLMKDVDEKQIFYQFQMGDATTHAMATCFMKPGTYEAWGSFPYGHNTNDLGQEFYKEEYKQECKQAYSKAGVPVPSYEYKDNPL